MLMHICPTPACANVSVAAWNAAASCMTASHWILTTMVAKLHDSRGYCSCWLGYLVYGCASSILLQLLIDWIYIPFIVLWQRVIWKKLPYFILFIHYLIGSMLWLLHLYINRLDWLLWYSPPVINCLVWLFLSYMCHPLCFNCLQDQIYIHCIILL